MTRRVFLDMDGVVVDFDGYLRTLQSLRDDPDVKSLTGDDVKRLRGAYLAMKPMPGAIDGVRSLIGMGFDVWLATKPPTGISWAYATLERMGYTYTDGAALWSAPPGGIPPEPSAYTKTVRYDLAPLQVESELRTKAIELGWVPPELLPTDPCIAKRKPGEPMFTLLGRDPVAASLVHLWAMARSFYLLKQTSGDRLADAIGISERMAAWCTNEGRITSDVLDLLPTSVLTKALTKRGYLVTLEYAAGSDPLES